MQFDRTGTEHLLVGNTLDNPASAESGNAVSYRSSNAAVATVNDQGLVTGIGVGNATITAEVAADAVFAAASADYQVEVRRPQSLNFDKTTIPELAPDSTFRNRATAESGGTVSYRSSDEAVATVNNDGLVTGISVGNATITAEVAADEEFAAASNSFAVQVIAKTAQNLTFTVSGDAELNVGDTFDNPATVSPSSATISYTSSQPSVATVNAQGLVTAVGAGTATITASVEANDEFAAASENYEVIVSLKSQSLTFETSTTAKLLVGESLENPASSEENSNASIRYSSSNPSVATVTDAGLVTTLSAGTTQISAEVDADTEFAAATASYYVDVIASTARLGAWVGDTGAELVLSEGLVGVELYGSSDPDCDFDNPPCTNDRAFVLVPANGPIDDPHLTLSQPGHYQLRHGNHRLESSLNAETTQPGFARRQGHQAVLFQAEGDSQERIWLVGGYNSNTNQRFNDVWSSADGLHWTRHNAVNTEAGNNLFAPRYEHQLVVFNNQLWLIGGETSSGELNDVWSSPDGVRWTEVETVNAQDQSLGVFPARSGHQLAVFDAGNGPELWLIGGFTVANDHTSFNDVWSSVDGIRWTEHPIEGGQQRFSGREDHQVVVFDAGDGQGERLWLLGGGDADGSTLGDIWSSTDGSHWNKATGTMPFTSSYHQVVATGTGGEGELWFMDGDILQSSNDGLTWTPRGTLPAYRERRGVVVVDKAGPKEGIMMIGGSDTNEIWLTPTPPQGEPPLWHKSVTSNEVSFTEEDD